MASTAATATATAPGDYDKKSDLEVAAPELFNGDRHKFEAFQTQVKLYVLADGRKVKEKRAFQSADEKALWACSFLRGDAFARLEPYVSQRLQRGSWGSCDPEVRRVMENTDRLFEYLAQTYGDLEEAHTAELKLLELQQKGTVPEYLARFTQHASRVSWNERARMAQFYKGLRPNIKDAMAISGFPSSWTDLIAQATRLDDHFRRRAQEDSGKGSKWGKQGHQKPHKK